MKVIVFYDRENKEKTVELSNNATIKDLLAKMNINPVTVIASRNSNIIPEDEKIEDNDNIRLFSVISGG